MARFFVKDGNYFETITDVEPDETGVWSDGRIEVPQKPSADHEWRNGGWVSAPNLYRINEEARIAAARQELSKPMPTNLAGVVARLAAIELLLGINSK